LSPRDHRLSAAE